MLDPPFGTASFDHLFVCFVLEHLSDPADALARLAALVRPGGTVTVIEGDHGSAYFHPDSAAARAAIDCQVQLQAGAGGDALIGRRVYPLMVRGGPGRRARVPADGLRGRRPSRAGRRVHAQDVHGDGRGRARPGDRCAADRGRRFDAGVRDLHRTAEADGTFSYTFFKGTGTRRATPQR